MALNIWKWFGGVVAGGALLWLWMFHDRKPGDAIHEFVRRGVPVGAATPSVSSEMNRALDRLRLLQLRDSLVAATPKTANELTVSIDGRYGESTKRAIEAKLRERWSRLRAPAKVPVVIAAIVDSASTVEGFPRRKPSGMAPPITTFLPGASTGSRCISFVRIPYPLDTLAPKFVARNLLSPETIDGLLSPCIYYAEFGAPGPQIAKWLAEGGWRMAHHADWATPAPHWNGRATTTYFSTGFDHFTSLDDPAWSVRLSLTTRGIACMGGESGRCQDAAMSSRLTPDDSTWRANVVSPNATNQATFYLPSAATNLGPYDAWLVSEMTRSLGTERFASFWQSRAPVSDAFRVAAGQELDEWIHDWGNRVYGPIAVGPGVSGAAVLSGIAIFCLALTTAISIARRRRVA
jgi:hypothetical protein